MNYGEQLDLLAAKGNLRSLPQMVHQGKYAIVGGERMLNLSSNDYLGLAGDGELMRGFLAEAAGAFGDGGRVDCVSGAGCEADCGSEYLLSSTSSRLLTGTFDVHSRLEATLARLFGREAALVFSSGYHMNEGILPAVADESTLILADKLVHASIIDGIRLSVARCVRFRHNDMGQLESLLDKYVSDYERIIIVTESIFSMDGDVAPLQFLVGMKRRYPSVMLYVDEAHAVGVRGANGLGVAEEQGVIGDIDFLCGTFGKALASVGAYVVCDAAMRDFLVNRMRPLIFTTALPPLNVAWTLRVVESLSGMVERRERLARHSERVREAVLGLGLDCPSQSHIVPVMAGESSRAVELAARMRKAGFYLLPIRPPTVPEGTSRLRISLTAGLSDEDVEELVAVLRL